MAQRKRDLVLTLLLICVCVTGWGAKPEEEEAPVQFRMLSLFDTNILLYDTGEQTERIYATQSRVTDWYDAPEDGRIKFFRELPPEAPGLPERKEKIADLKLPSGPGPFLIILKQKEDGSGLEMAAIDHSLATHEPQTYRVFNFTKRRLAIQIANKNMVIEPGRSEFAAYPSGRKAWLKIAVNRPESGWIKIMSKPRPVKDATRTALFILDIPPSEADPNPLGVIVREANEEIIESEDGVLIK